MRHEQIALIPRQSAAKSGRIAIRPGTDQVSPQLPNPAGQFVAPMASRRHTSSRTGKP